jgi:hypothetical protein
MQIHVLSEFEKWENQKQKIVATILTLETRFQRKFENSFVYSIFEKFQQKSSQMRPGFLRWERRMQLR